MDESSITQTESRRLFLVDDELIFDFPYDADQVRAIKQIAGARWDKLARVWRVPMVSLLAAREFAQKHDIEVDEEVALFTLPQPKNPTFGVVLQGEWIFLSFAYDPVKVRAVKTIPAVTWHAKTKAWRVPISSAAQAIEWADLFGEPVADELRTLAAALDEAHSDALAASRSVDAEVDVPGMPLLNYQRAGVAYAVQHRRCFIADDMGLGKTITSIAALEALTALNQTVYPAIVVCPPSLVLNWQREWQRWCPERRVECITNRKDFPNDYEVVVIGYSNVSHWQAALSKHAAMIVDESHYIKTPTAQRTKAVIKIARSLKTDAPIFCLTGTPVTNRPAEYASQLDALGRLNEFGGRWGFYRRYCNAFRDRWGQWHIDGHSNLDELNDRLRGGGLYIRRTKEQVLHDLPPVLHSPIIVEGDAARMKEYRRAEADIVDYLVERAKEVARELGLSVHASAVAARMKAEAAEHVVRLSVLRRLAALAKLPMVGEWVEQHVEGGRKVVLAAHHRDVVGTLAEQFGNCRIQGGMSVAEVEDAKARFQELPTADCPVIVLSIQAAKTGHTLTAAQDVGFVELPFTPADVDQTYSRCHRLGQAGSVSATYFLAANTVDEVIYAKIAEKRAVVNMATEGGAAEAVGDTVGQAVVMEYLQRGLGSE